MAIHSTYFIQILSSLIFIIQINKYIFSSGNPIILEDAVDNIFDFPNIPKYVKIERVVEIFKPTENNWRILGTLSDVENSSIYKENYYRLDSVEEIEKDCDQCKFRININDSTLTFPKIFTKIFLGKVKYNILIF